MSLRVARMIAFLWTACIVIGTLTRGSQVGQHMRTIGLLHLALHGCIFSVFGALLVVSLGRSGLPLRILTLAFGIALGASTELYEHLAFGNEMEYIDVATNTLGVCMGFAVGETLQRRARS